MSLRKFLVENLHRAAGVYRKKMSADKAAITG
jgi:hypothetical protein